MDLDKSAARRRLLAASDRDFIHNLEERRGVAGHWVVGEPMPEETELLPPPCHLQSRETADQPPGGTVAGDSEGVKGGGVVERKVEWGRVSTVVFARNVRRSHESTAILSVRSAWRVVVPRESFGVVPSRGVTAPGHCDSFSTDSSQQGPPQHAKRLQLAQRTHGLGPTLKRLPVPDRPQDACSRPDWVSLR